MRKSLQLKQKKAKKAEQRFNRKRNIQGEKPKSVKKTRKKARNPVMTSQMLRTLRAKIAYIESKTGTQENGKLAEKVNKNNNDS